MVISFSLDEPLNHLMDKGYVYTFRKNERKRIGKDWFNDGRGRMKLGDCYITLRIQYDYNVITNKDNAVYLVGNNYMILKETIRPYHKYSGFNSVDEWIHHIIKLNKGITPIKGYVYKVVTR